MKSFVERITIHDLVQQTHMNFVNDRLDSVTAYDELYFGTADALLAALAQKSCGIAGAVICCMKTKGLDLPQLHFVQRGDQFVFVGPMPVAAVYALFLTEFAAGDIGGKEAGYFSELKPAQQKTVLAHTVEIVFHTGGWPANYDIASAQTYFDSSDLNFYSDNNVYEKEIEAYFELMTAPLVDGKSMRPAFSLSYPKP